MRNVYRRELLDSIIRLDRSLTPPASQHEQLASIMGILRTEIQPRVRASAVHAFGSSSNGLWTRASDADITVIVPRCNNKLKLITKLKTMRDYVNKIGLLPGPMELVENARIPVLKLRLTNAEISEVDLSINNISGIENSLLVKQWTLLDDRFVPLARAIKFWAKQRGINDRSKGTLSTYTLLLQLVYVMQVEGLLPAFASFVKPHILENPFEELNGVERELPFDTEFRMGDKPDMSIEELFLRFFEVFTQFPEGAEIADGEIVAAPTVSGGLVMRCPLTGMDVNRMSSSAWKSLHGEFVRAHQLLQNGASLDDLVSIP